MSDATLVALVRVHRPQENSSDHRPICIYKGLIIAFVVSFFIFSAPSIISLNIGKIESRETSIPYQSTSPSFHSYHFSFHKVILFVVTATNFFASQSQHAFANLVLSLLPKCLPRTTANRFIIIPNSCTPRHNANECIIIIA